VTRVLVVTGGHPFEQEPFLDVFRSLEGIRWEHVPHPAALDCFRVGRAGEWDAIVCYDMPGIEFRQPQLPRYAPPPAGYAAGLLDMLAAGQGIVFLHHAMTAWPAWAGWPQIVGGRWQYRPGVVAGALFPASGYTREVAHRISVLDPGHPVCAGLDGGFPIVDELYLNPVLTEIIHPVLATDYPAEPGAFFSGELAMRNQMYSREGWSHPPGAGLVGWVKTAGRSPVAYLQPGHGPAAYANAGYRRLVANAIGWVASAQARDWARENPSLLPPPPGLAGPGGD
jgi:type 1 glutamine amidotransferase